ncbi:hypothetical protein [Vibrio owensii]|uniref:hypothetical protein n=1 Tax=Vibrio owensii TaxID=696485 RepID=UPI0018F1695D|nr:hypothetical protein [Vibrio owensii]
MIVDCTFFKNDQELVTDSLKFDDLTEKLTRLFVEHTEDTEAVMGLKWELKDKNEATYEVPKRFRNGRFNKILIKPKAVEAQPNATTNLA